MKRHIDKFTVIRHKEGSYDKPTNPEAHKRRKQIEKIEERKRLKQEELM